MQAAFSLRLIWTRTAFIDEATYIYAGHEMIAHWLHGIPVPPYPTWLSGSPALYPPLGALADSLGGLAGARLLGLAFMLSATVLLYFAAKRLFDGRAALFSAILFASLAGTQFLGAFATYDPMALFLLALSAFLVVRHGGGSGLRDVILSCLVAPVVLAVADATKYATALWNPAVIGLAFIVPITAGASKREAAGRAARFAGVLVAVICGALFGIGHGEYLQGIAYTTLDRNASVGGMGQSPTSVLKSAWEWIGIVVVLAAAGIAVLCATDRRRWRSPLLVLGLLLFAATLAAPLEQARIGTLVSLQKHVVYGAWFGCIPAGFALARVLRWRPAFAAGATAALALLPLALAAQASSFYSWGQENLAFTAALKPLVHPGTGRYLVEGFDDITAYYVGDVYSIQWKEAGTGDFQYTDPATGRRLPKNGASLAAAVRAKYFTLIILNFAEPNDALIAADIAKYGGYRVVATLPPSAVGSKSAYTVWAATGSAVV